MERAIIMFKSRMLTTDKRKMTYFTVLRIRHGGCPFTEVTDKFPRIVAYAFSQLRLPDKRTKFLCKFSGSENDRKRYFRAFKAHPLTEKLDRISDAKDASIMSVVIDYSKTTGNIMSIVEKLGIHHSDMVTHKEGSEEWIIYAKDEATIDSLVKELRTSDCEVKLLKTYPIDSLEDTALRIGLKEALNSLTPKQKYIFKVAYSMGYYDGKKKVTLDQIVDELDISKPAVWKHIQTVEGKIMKVVSELI